MSQQNIYDNDEFFNNFYDIRSSEIILAESENYYIVGAYEQANLYRKSDDKYVCCVGQHYGDPLDALIDKNEKFCVVVGCGVIVFRLKEPFESYVYDKECDQWYEFGRDPKNVDWIISVKQISDNEVELLDEAENSRVIKIKI